MKKRNAKVFAMFMTSMLTFTSIAPTTVLAAEEEVVAVEVAEEEAVVEEEAEAAEEAVEEDAEEEGVVGEAAVLEEEDAVEEATEEAETEETELTEKSDAAYEVLSGNCGGTTGAESVSYKLYSDGTLEILAHGSNCRMADYDSFEDTPWAILPEELFITSVEVGGEVVYIGKHAFDGVETIQNVWFSEYVQVVGDYAFQDCTGLTKVEFTDQNKISVTTYGVGCFKNCTALRTITWGNKLQRVSAEAFYNCVSLVTDLNFSTGLKYIDEAAFWGCSSLKRLIVPYTVVKIGGSLHAENSDDIAASGAAVKEGVRGAFAYCTGLENVDFKVTNAQSVKEIDDFAFYGDKSIGKVVVPGTVEVFGDYVFAACTGLSTAEIRGYEIRKNGADEEYVWSEIEELKGTFMRCTNLTTVTIGTWHEIEEIGFGDYVSGVKTIGTRCFNDCTSLTTVNWETKKFDGRPYGATVIGKQAFFRCSALKAITLPSALEEIYEDGFRNCTALDNVTVPDRTEYIGNNAFYNCTSFTNIMLPRSLEEIGDAAFAVDNTLNMKLVDIYYGGDEDDWEDLLDEVGTNNKLLTSEEDGVKSNVYFQSRELDIPTGLKVTYVKKDNAEDDVVRVEWDEMVNAAGVEASSYELYVCHQKGMTYDQQMGFVSYIPVWEKVFDAPGNYYESLVANYERGDNYYFRLRAVWDNDHSVAWANYPYNEAGGRLCERYDYQVPANRDAIAVESITTNKANYDIVVGKTMEATLTVAPSNYTDTKFSWTPEDPSIASVTVSQDGKTATINALKEGTTVINVKAANGVSTACTVTVKPVGANMVTGIQINQTNPTVSVGANTELSITITPADADDTVFHWDAFNEKIATVVGTEDGKSATVTGKMVGSTEITVTSDNGVSATVTVNVTEAQDKVEAFVNRIYSVWLKRAPQGDDVNFWTTNLKSGAWSGAAVAEYFIFSAESMEMQRDNEDFLAALYKLLMDRDPAADPEGFNYWLTQMNGGMSKYQVVASFIASPEYTQICANTGITRGSVDMDTVGKVQEFVTRFYTLAMERSADIAGVDYWTAGLRRNDFNGASIATNFFFGPEFTAKNTSNQKYIELLYNVMMGRFSDEGGMAYWMSQLGVMSRQDVLNGFITSPEFTGICADYGITRGM